MTCSNSIGFGRFESNATFYRHHGPPVLSGSDGSGVALGSPCGPFSHFQADFWNALAKIDGSFRLVRFGGLFGLFGLLLGCVVLLVGSFWVLGCFWALWFALKKIAISHLLGTVPLFRSCASDCCRRGLHVPRPLPHEEKNGDTPMEHEPHHFCVTTARTKQKHVAKYLTHQTTAFCTLALHFLTNLPSSCNSAPQTNLGATHITHNRATRNMKRTIPFLWPV